VDLVTGAERVEVLGLVQVPKHGSTVLTAGSAEGSVRGDGNGVDVAGVTDVVGLNAASGELPNLLIVNVSTRPSHFTQRKRVELGRLVSTPVEAKCVSLPVGSEVANTL
jgi:hypothetical protein